MENRRAKHRTVRLALKIFFSLLLGSVVALALFVMLILAGAFGKLPDAATLIKIQNPIATEVYTADGVLMGTYNIQNRQYLDPLDITCNIEDALIATEDVRFYHHNGIDTRSLFRVFFKTILLSKENSGGGSTLTQQLVKNLFPRGDYGAFSIPANKVKEMATARRMEQIYSKEEILELYLSTVPFGENTFGIKAASRRYFNTEPKDLPQEDAAVLVGMLKATGSYNPVRNPEQALARRNVVLSQMARYNYLDSTEADSLKLLPLEADYHPLPHNAGIAPYFREHIRPELDAWCRKHLKNGSDPYNLYTDGLKVYTTIDSRMQLYAEEAMQRHMSHLQEIFREQWKGRQLWQGITEKQMLIGYDGEPRAGMASEPTRKMEVFSWEGSQVQEFNTLDSLRHYLQFLQTGILAMDPATAEIKAWVGGINHEYFKYDHVTARRQTGSTFKPLVYLEALEQGISPCEYLPNDSVAYEEFDNWVPRNADRSYGGYYSLKGALTHSVNTVSVGLLMRVGIDSVLEISRKAGIEAPLPAVPSLALGTGEISLFEMLGAYQAIANRGMARKAVYITRIEDRKGNILKERKPEAEGTPICSPENADLMTAMLRNVVNKGTASGLRSRYGMEADIAGKTGTTQNYTDGWFIGFTPSLLCGVWVGGDLQNVRFRTLQYGQGAYAAMPIWAGFMNRTFGDVHWQYLQEEQFRLGEHIDEQMQCEDFLEDKPREFTPIKNLKKKRLFRRIFRRDK